MSVWERDTTWTRTGGSRVEGSVDSGFRLRVREEGMDCRRGSWFRSRVEGPGCREQGRSNDPSPLRVQFRGKRQTVDADGELEG